MAEKLDLDECEAIAKIAYLPQDMTLALIARIRELERAASPADQGEDARDAVCGLKPGCCHKCGLPLSQNPHPEAGKPDHYLEVGCPRECIPCTVKGRHNWASEAMKNRSDAARYRSAIALEDNAETLYAAVLNHGGGNSFAINAEFDAAMSASKEGA